MRTRFQCDSATGAPINTFDSRNVQVPAAGQVMTPCNKLPLGLISIPMQRFLQAYAPKPNLTGSSAFNYQQVRPDTNNANGFHVRVDHRFRASDNVFFRYTEQRVT